MRQPRRARHPTSMLPRALNVQRSARPSTETPLAVAERPTWARRASLNIEDLLLIGGTAALHSVLHGQCSLACSRTTWFVSLRAICWHG